MSTQKKYKIGLALSGGGIRGVSHLGVIKAMEEMGLKAEIVSGVSAGSIVGSLYAAGYTTEEILTFFKKSSIYKGVNLNISMPSVSVPHKVREVLSRYEVMDRYMPAEKPAEKARHNKKAKSGGIVNPMGYRSYLRDFLQQRNVTHFSDLKIPFIVGATKLETGTFDYFCQDHVFGSVPEVTAYMAGEAGHNAEQAFSVSVEEAVEASSSVPILFNPLMIGDSHYVDGGMLCNMPAEVLRPLCEVVIGVHVNPILNMPADSTFGLKEVAERVFHLAVNGNTRRQKEFCDIVINMEQNKNVGMFDSAKSAELFQNGYNEAIKAFKAADFTKFNI